MDVSRVKKFCVDTDTHGVKFLVDSSSSVQRKVLWAMMICASLGFMQYLFVIRITHYLKREVTTKVSVEHKDIKLPSLKVCMNVALTFDPSKLTADDIVNARRVEDGLLYLNETRVFVEVGGKRSIDQPAIEIFKRLIANPNASPEDAAGWFAMEKTYFFGALPAWRVLLQALVDHGSDRPLADRNLYNYSDVLNRARYDYTADMDCVMLRATEAGYEYEDCRQGWRSVDVDGGMCVVRSFVGTGAVGVRNLTFFRDKTTEMFPDYAFSNYHLIVESEKEAVSSALDRYVSSGASMMTATVARIRRKTEVRRLGQPFGDCELNEQYSKGRCVAACVAGLWHGKYGCREPYMTEADGSIPICRWPMNTVFIDNYGEVRSLRAACAQTCRVECSMDTYEFFPATNVDMTSVVNWPVSRPFLIIDLDPSTVTEIVHVQEIELYPIGSLLAELGGTMGLFIGISVLSIAHLLEFISTSFSSYCCQRKRNILVEEEMMKDTVKNLPDSLSVGGWVSSD